jgi:hypothetical protein
VRHVGSLGQLTISIALGVVDVEESLPCERLFTMIRLLAEDLRSAKGKMVPVPDGVTQKKSRLGVRRLELY